MSGITMALAILLVIITPSLLHFGFKLSGKKLKTVIGINIFGFFAILAVAAIILFGNSSTYAQEAASATGNSAAGFAYIAAAIVTSFATIGAGIAVAVSASAAIGAISENPNVTGKALVFVALAEGIALYGVLVSFMILGKV